MNLKMTIKDVCVSSSRMSEASDNIIFTLRNLTVPRSTQGDWQGSGIRRTHPQRLTASRPAAVADLSRWDVVNTVTL
ncbi:MAG: hypothetical protein ACQEXX_12695 [Bacillota bacterium]